MDSGSKQCENRFSNVAAAAAAVESWPRAELVTDLLPVCFYHFPAALVHGLASLMKVISQQGIPSFKALVSDWQSVCCSQSCTSACCPLLKLSGPLHACTICMDIRPLTTSNQYHFCIGCWQFLIILEYFRVTSGMQQYWPGETALKNGLQLLSSTQKVIDWW